MAAAAGSKSLPGSAAAICQTIIFSDRTTGGGKKKIKHLTVSTEKIFHEKTLFTKKPLT